MKRAPLLAIVLIAGLSAAACGGGTATGNPLVEDSSASGVAASSAGGALSGSSASGTLAYFMMPGLRKQGSVLASIREAFDFSPFAFASVACPTFKTTGVGCMTNATTMWLSYGNCSFGGAMTWNGTQAIIMSAGSPACGSFPSVANGTLIRQYVTGAGLTTPGSVTLTPSSSSTMSGLIDDSATVGTLKNFNNDSLATLGSTGGYGQQITFASGVRTQIKTAHRFYAAGSPTPSFDHTVYGTLTISESGGATSRTITGQSKVYHNVFQVIATSTFNNVVHQDNCCLPVSGSITTTFAAATGGSAVAPTAAGQLAVGKSETLQFTGCGTATLTDFNGNVINESLSRCF